MARKVALHSVENKLEAHRVAICGYATATGVSGVGIRVKEGVAGYSGLISCGSIHVCPVCAAKIAARRAEDLGEVLGWARREGHTLAMVTMTVSHKRKDALGAVWDAVSTGWGSVTSGGVWNNAETDQEYDARLAQWEASGFAHEEAKRLGQKPPRAPRGWHKRQQPEIKRGDKAKYGVLGWARAVEVTRGANGWHVHIHAVLVLEGRQQAHERAYALGRSMHVRWNKGIAKKGFTSSKEHGLRIDVSEGAERQLAEYLTKAGEPEKQCAIQSKRLEKHWREKQRWGSTRSRSVVGALHFRFWLILSLEMLRTGLYGQNGYVIPKDAASSLGLQNSVNWPGCLPKNLTKKLRPKKLVLKMTRFSSYRSNPGVSCAETRTEWRMS